ncbi:N-alpha-acetyltransferase 50 [Capsicum baccatum]|uniref:N-alpha-acetyltransferase 50 n=2 Tax=Capsicum TaxID=4071 RepID=A0A1U8GUI6_CAPAN|nr:N-alpha-acetyltransferase 50 [Capsicum annuum]PHT45744.1 N-alpha-acetyltransferase 50 [Capsicum baccatum]PHU14829.1 N-alpha-acetyltransferase 50 [Capsicum chinense]KAF3630435.1 N-alpha-acetyltransferase 50 [Capsicum annuum]KAF3632643.1 N-alpha-acetyltransferase 50 [Capsicum annuum]PHT79109.1 N-alpha-acetyltransferase 50 [Capsicum annuum]
MGAGGREVPISLDGVRDKNIMQLKKINTAIFPVRYNDKYYTDAIASGDFTRLAYYNDICVGSIACRLEKKEGGPVRVYIMTLGVLAPYRGLGTGTKLLNHVLDLCAKQNVSDIYLHVHTINEDAINFYKKFGFEVTDKIQNYYTNITPPDCFVLTKFITPPKKQTV